MSGLARRRRAELTPESGRTGEQASEQRVEKHIRQASRRMSVCLGAADSSDRSGVAIAGDDISVTRLAKVSTT